MYFNNAEKKNFKICHYQQISQYYQNYEIIIIDEGHSLKNQKNNGRPKKSFVEALQLRARFTLIITGTIFDTDFSPWLSCLDILRSLKKNYYHNINKIIHENNNINNLYINDNLKMEHNLMQNIVQSMTSAMVVNGDLYNRIEMAKRILEFHNSPLSSYRIRRRVETTKSYKIDENIYLITLDEEPQKEYENRIRDINSTFDLLRSIREISNANEKKIQFLISYINDKVLPTKNDKLLIFVEYININGSKIMQQLSANFKKNLHIQFINQDTTDLQRQCSMFNKYSSPACMIISMKLGNCGVDIYGANHVIIYEMVIF